MFKALPTFVRVASLCIVVAACSLGPTGETIGCGCAEEYFAYADIDRWKAGAAQNNPGDMASLEKYYRAKGWFKEANDLFDRRVIARDPDAIAQVMHVRSLKQLAAQDNVQAIRELAAYYSDAGNILDARRMHLRLVDLNDPNALDKDASHLFREAINLPDGSAER